MFSGILEPRYLNMSDQEKRWLENVKKAFYESDCALTSETPEDRTLEELFKAVDTAKTLRRSLRGEDTSTRDNKNRFIEFLALEIPAASSGTTAFTLRDRATGKLRDFSFGELIYAIRCMIHENENLNASEGIDYHILVDWSARTTFSLGQLVNEQFIINGWFLANRLREVLAKFITGIEASIAYAEGRSFYIGIRPPIGAIASPRQLRRE